MKCFYALILLFAISTLQSKAQRNFKPGYIVSLNGDTTKGFVDYKEWRENPKFITFKMNEQDAAQNYSPQTIRTFSILDADAFIRYIGPVTKGEVELSNLSVGIDSSFVTDSIFLKTLISGENITLYSYTDRIKVRFFIAEKNLAPTELKRYVYLDSKQANKLREFNFFTQQLLNLAIKYQPNNNVLITNIYKTPYISKDLQEMTLQVNAGTNTNKTYGLNRGARRYYLGLGGDLTQAKFNGVGVNSIFDSKKTITSVGPVITAGADFLFDKNVGNWLFRVELALSAANVNASHSYSYMQGLKELRADYNITFNQYSAAINPQLVYNIYNRQNFKFYLAGGVQLGFSTYANKRYSTTIYFNNNLQSVSDNKFPLKSLIPNYTAKAGVVLSKKFDITFAYLLRQNITPYEFYGQTSLTLSTYRVGINYLFGLK